MTRSFWQQDWRGKLLFAVDVLLVGILFTISFYRSFWAFPFMLLPGIVFANSCERKRRKRQKEQLEEEFKECVLAVAVSMQAGYSAENAFLEAYKDMENRFGREAEICRELRTIRRGLGVNKSLESLLTEFGETSGLDQVKHFAGVFSIARTRGGNVVKVFSDAASDISIRSERRAEWKTLLAGKQLEQHIMQAMPFGILLYVGNTYGGFFDALYADFTGLCIRTAAVGAYIAAFLLGERILERVDRQQQGICETKSLMDYGGKGLLGSLQKRIRPLIKTHGVRKDTLSVRKQKRALETLFPAVPVDKAMVDYLSFKLAFEGLLAGAECLFVLGCLVRGIPKEAGFGGTVWGAVVLLSLPVVTFFLLDKDLLDKAKEKKREYALQYPELVRKLSLYLGAGLSVRGCFALLAPEQETILLANRELLAGKAESAVYTQYGKRCGTEEYIRLGTLLSQNVRKGNRELLVRLEEEAAGLSRMGDRALKKAGEEAETKLLVPIVMYLAVTMLLIMVPAFMSLK